MSTHANYCVAACACLLTLFFVPEANGQQLTGANFVSFTGNAEKDDDTGVFVAVYTADRKTKLAEVLNADNCNDDRCEYDDKSRHELTLRVLMPLQKSACANFVIVIGSRANGSDTWDIQRADVTLRFDDGTTLTRTIYNVRLNSRRSMIVTVEL